MPWIHSMRYQIKFLTLYQSKISEKPDASLGWTYERWSTHASVFAPRLMSVVACDGRLSYAWLGAHWTTKWQRNVLDIFSRVGKDEEVLIQRKFLEATPIHTPILIYCRPEANRQSFYTWEIWSLVQKKKKIT